ncbi:MAG: cold shock domain-containing protein [Anaerolineae bacterium]
MVYQDTWATCTRCGGQFVFRIEEQRQQAERGEEIAPPDLCPSCRALARAVRRSKPRRAPRSRPAAEQKLKTPVILGPGPHEGNVKWYDPEKGYGFIVHPSGEELFFHRTGIAPGEAPHFPDGTRVTYLVERTKRGLQAVDVARMDVEGGV